MKLDSPLAVDPDRCDRRAWSAASAAGRGASPEGMIAPPRRVDQQFTTAFNKWRHRRRHGDLRPRSRRRRCFAPDELVRCGWIPTPQGHAAGPRERAGRSHRAAQSAVSGGGRRRHRLGHVPTRSPPSPGKRHGRGDGPLHRRQGATRRQAGLTSLDHASVPLPPPLRGLQTREVGPEEPRLSSDDLDQPRISRARRTSSAGRFGCGRKTRRDDGSLTAPISPDPRRSPARSVGARRVARIPASASRGGLDMVAGTVGIDAMAFHGPECFVDMTELATARGVDPGEVHQRPGSASRWPWRRLRGHREPCHRRGAQVAHRLRHRSAGDRHAHRRHRDGRRPQQACRWSTCIELLGLPSNCRAPAETKHACYGAMAGLTSAIDWIAPAGRAARRFPSSRASDMRALRRGTPGEPTQGRAALSPWSCR